MPSPDIVHSSPHSINDKIEEPELPVAVVVLISKDGVPILIQTKNHVVPDTDSDPKLK